ncbi:MAG: hypothetical protein IT160_13205 [Bryobacterales bacterium]|nr:hypothetical protein [Bryobacterales bacterium]
MLWFLLFSITVFIIYYLHFAVAQRAWRQMRGGQSNEIDLHYVRVEDYFGRSFRSKMQDWMELPALESSTANLREIEKGNERLYIAPAAAYPDSVRESGILAIENTFTCGSGCRFQREIYVRDTADIGVNSRLQAIAVDGNLTLRQGVQVVRWVDAKGILDIRDRCRVGARATSATRIVLGLDSRCLSLFAPEIETQGRQEIVSSLPRQRPGSILIPPPENEDGSLAEQEGINLKRLHRMSSDTWIYEGDLEFRQAVQLRANLVVMGKFVCGEASLLEGDVRARLIRVGTGSLCKGNLVAEGELLLARHTTFQGILHSGGAMRLARGVRGFNVSQQVAAFAGERLAVEPNVVVHGKLSSNQFVQAVFGASK